MRRGFLIFCLTISALLWSGCGGGSNVNEGANANSETLEAPSRANSSNIAPTGGPGPEPENAGSVSKNSNKAESKRDESKKDESNKNKKAP